MKHLTLSFALIKQHLQAGQNKMKKYLVIYEKTKTGYLAYVPKFAWCNCHGQNKANY